MGTGAHNGSFLLSEAKSRTKLRDDITIHRSLFNEAKPVYLMIFWLKMPSLLVITMV